MSIDAYYAGTTGRKRKREHLAAALTKEITIAPPSRMITLLGQAVKWQQFAGLLPSGSSFDLFQNTIPDVLKHRTPDKEMPPREAAGLINFGKGSNPECAIFSPDGQMLVTGSVDGFVEVWDFDTGKLKRELEYQMKDELMMHSTAVLALAFSRDGELLATGAKDGRIKVWKISTGVCVRRFKKAHAAGVTHLAFQMEAHSGQGVRSDSQLLSASFDYSMKLHGLKSGKTLKVFTGHTSYVNSCSFAYTAGGVVRAISASSDSSVKVWDLQTTDCLMTFGSRLCDPERDLDVAINCAISHPMDGNLLIVCNKSPKLFITNLTGKVLQTYSSAAGIGG